MFELKHTLRNSIFTLQDFTYIYLFYMRNLRFFCAMLAAMLACSVTQAQVITTDPAVVTENTKNLTITFHADWGNHGMAGLDGTMKVYAHTGVITNLSKNNGDWRYCTSDWNAPQEKFRMTYAGVNLWTLTIADIREFYGVPAGETIEKLKFVFHASPGSQEGKTSVGGDVALTLMPDNFPAATQADFPGGAPVPGVTTNPDGSATFCMLAPDKTSVVLRGSWNNYTIVPEQQMHYTTGADGMRYFWTTVNDLTPDTDYIYYYLVDYQMEVGDAWAQLVLDADNDKYIPSTVYPDMPAYPARLVNSTMVAQSNIPLAVYNSGAGRYSWEVTDFKGVAPADLIIYELLVRDFTGTEGQRKGDGTIKGVIDKLDYIKSLGVNAVELMPVMEFSGNQSWGYNPNFYFAPDKAYGTPDDYRLLVDECHKRGLAVIVDVVFNHVDGWHPWFNMYPPVTSPVFNAFGSAPHDYSVFNDWKQESPMVELQFEEALKFWLTSYNVDGFRFDLVKGLGYNDSYGNSTYDAATNTWGKPGNLGDLTNKYNASRVERMKKLHDAMRSVNPDAYFINENLAGEQEENEMAADGELNWVNVNYNSCQFAMGYQSGSELNNFYAPNYNRTWGSTVSYAESHDEERMAYKQKTYGATGVKNNTEMSMRRLGSLAAQMILTPGAHMIWQFQEFGDDQTTKNSDGSNNTGNKKVVWSLLDKPANSSLRDSYAALCKIRNDNSLLFTGNAEATVTLNPWTGGRSIALTSGERQLLLAVNPAVNGSAIDMYVPVNIDIKRLQLLNASPSTTPGLSTTHVTGLEPGAYAVFCTDTEPAGIDGVGTDTATTPFTVDVADGTIVVSAPDGRTLAPSEFEVYNTMGMQVGAEVRAHGIYLVRALGSTQKVRI